MCIVQEWRLYFPQFHGAPALKPAGFQSQMGLCLLIPDPQAGESDVELRTFTPAGDPLQYNYCPVCGSPTQYVSFVVVLVVKNVPATAGRRKRRRCDPWVRKTPWRRAWQPTAVFLPGESHGQRSLAGCSPSGSIRRVEHD